MDKRSRQNSNTVKVGEIIRIESKYPIPPAGVYRVDACMDGMLMLSAGEIHAGVAMDGVRIVERNLPQPTSWLAVEVELLGMQVLECDCPDCRALLVTKQAELAKLKESMQEQHLN